MFGNLSRVSCCFRHLDTRRRPISWDLFPPSRGPRQSRHRTPTTLHTDHRITATDLLHCTRARALSLSALPDMPPPHTRVVCSIVLAGFLSPVVFLISRFLSVRRFQLRLDIDKFCYHGLSALFIEVTQGRFMYITNSSSMYNCLHTTSSSKVWPHKLFMSTSCIHNLSNDTKITSVKN